jgi:hypothetical protein
VWKNLRRFFIVTAVRTTNLTWCMLGRKAEKAVVPVI